MMKFIFFILISQSIFAQSDSNDLIDFSTIKDLLEKDNLEKSALQKKEKIQKKQKRKTARQVAKYKIPDEDDFWNFSSELWLIKNNSILKWDFQKPDYGIEDAFKDFLERVGKYEIKFNILLLNSSNVTHFALPSGHRNYLLVLSVPFIRTLDLTKLQISLLLYEDVLRAEANFFKDYIVNDKVSKFVGSNFYQKKFDKETIDYILKKYDEFILDKGFNFKQQFEVTKKMDRIFKSNPKFWNAYYQMIKKKDELVKSNLLYKNYSKIYPSPELQMNWLMPSKNRF